MDFQEEARREAEASLQKQQLAKQAAAMAKFEEDQVGVFSHPGFYLLRGVPFWFFAVVVLSTGFLFLRDSFLFVVVFVFVTGYICFRFFLLRDFYFHGIPSCLWW